MSRVAGVLLVIYGLGCLSLSLLEIASGRSLSNSAAIITGVLGLLLCFAGAAHFKAPHKALLATVPLLLYFHTQMYFNALFYFDEPQWPLQLLFAACSLVIMVASYLGYSRTTRTKAYA